VKRRAKRDNPWVSAAADARRSLKAFRFFFSVFLPFARSLPLSLPEAATLGGSARSQERHPKKALKDECATSAVHSALHPDSRVREIDGMQDRS